MHLYLGIYSLDLQDVHYWSTCHAVGMKSLSRRLLRLRGGQKGRRVEFDVVRVWSNLIFALDRRLVITSSC